MTQQKSVEGLQQEFEAKQTELDSILEDLSCLESEEYRIKKRLEEIPKERAILKEKMTPIEDELIKLDEAICEAMDREDEEK